MTDQVTVIAIDGPSGAGKGTVAMILANKLGWHLLDSGALYRLLGLACYNNNIDFSDVTLGQWSAWSDCKKPCGGMSTRRRKCQAKKCTLEKKQCASMKREKRPCPKCT